MADMPLAAALIALIPGVHSWWTGRRLIARTSDPAFPELLLARAQQRGMVAVAAGVVAIPLETKHWTFTMALLLIGMGVGGFAFRKALYGERWMLPAYLRYMTQSIVAAAGFWLLLGFAPRMVVAVAKSWAPGQPVAATAVLACIVAAVLIAWERDFPRVWLALHNGSPLDRPELQARLEEIVQRAGSTRPSVFRYGAPGSYVMNAIALPSIQRPGVGFGDSLLEQLDADEITAVFAHEVAHLEHYNPRRLARLRVLTYLLIALGAALPIVAMATLPAYASIIAVMWPFVMLGVLLRRVSESQKHEAESDARSAELMGDPEPMIRALTKLHHYSKMPRRWPYDFERSASHPSLARRIQALRAHALAASAIPTAMEPVVLRSTKRGSYVVLDATRVYWLDGVAEQDGTGATSAAGQPATVPLPLTLAALRDRATSYRATTYAELSELRVGASGFTRALHVRDRAGKASATPLHPDDVAAAQHALDLLDGQLAPRNGHDWRRTARIAAALLGLLMVASLDFGWAWIPLLATLIAPGAWSLAATGLLVGGRAALEALAGTVRLGPPAWFVAILAIVGGGIACAIAWRWATAADPLRTRRMRQAAFAATASLLLLAVQGYRQRSAKLDWVSAPAEVITHFETDGFGRGVMLSPAGGRVAIQTVNQSAGGRYVDDEDVSWSFSVSSVSDRSVSGSRSIDALAMRFLDEQRILALRPHAPSGDSLELVELRLDADSSTFWRRVLPPISMPMLEVDRSSGAWTIVGHDMEAGEMMVLRGTLDSRPVTSERSSYELLGGRALHASPDGALILATMEMGSGTARMALAGLGVMPFEWTISRTRNGRRDRLGTVPGVPECTSDGSRTLHCIVTGADDTSLWRVDDGATLTRLGALPADYDLWRIGGPDRIVAAQRGGGRIAVVDAGAARATLLNVAASGGDERSFVLDAATAPGVVAALSTSGGRSALTVYRVR